MAKDPSSQMNRDYENRQRSAQGNSNFNQMNRDGNMGGRFRGGGGARGGGGVDRRPSMHQKNAENVSKTKGSSNPRL